jgi:hypothetical protein
MRACNYDEETIEADKFILATAARRHRHRFIGDCTLLPKRSSNNNSAETVAGALNAHKDTVPRCRAVFAQWNIRVADMETGKTVVPDFGK